MKSFCYIEGNLFKTRVSRPFPIHVFILIPPPALTVHPRSTHQSQNQQRTRQSPPSQSHFQQSALHRAVLSIAHPHRPCLLCHICEMLRVVRMSRHLFARVYFHLLVFSTARTLFFFPHNIKHFCANNTLPLACLLFFAHSIRLSNSAVFLSTFAITFLTQIPRLARRYKYFAAMPTDTLARRTAVRANLRLIPSLEYSAANKALFLHVLTLPPRTC